MSTISLESRLVSKSGRDNRVTVVQMRILFFVGLVALSGCGLFRPDYYEGTCVNAEGKEITRYVYPVTTGETSLPTTPTCDDRRQITVRTAE